MPTPLAAPPPPKDVPCSSGCLHPLAHIHFPQEVGAFRLKGAKQYDQYGHDLSAGYSARLEPDGQFTVSAYVYPAKVSLEEGFREVVDMMRRRWSQLAVQSQAVTVNGRLGWFAEAVIPDDAADTDGPKRTAVWLFQIDGWFIKYRVSAHGHAAWSPATRREFDDLITAVGWPGASARLERGRRAAVEASAEAVTNALAHAQGPLDDLAAQTLAALERGDHAAAQQLVENAPRPLPRGLQARVVAAALKSGHVTSAYFLAEEMRSDDDESRDVERLLCDWHDERIRFGDGVGAAPDTSVVVDAAEPDLRAHAIHQYLRWLLGPPGHLWWIRAIVVRSTDRGPMELADIALRDGRRVGVCFDTDLTTESVGAPTDPPAGVLRWPEPRSVEPHLELNPSLEVNPGEIHPVAMRLTEHAVQSFLAARRPNRGAEPDAPAFEALCALRTDYALLEIRYEQLPSPPEGARLEPVNGYIRYKAFMLCHDGPETYAAGDYFGMPKPEWGDARLEAVMSGARQLAVWCGLSPEAPLRGLGIAGFRDLLQTLHFSLVSQALVQMGDGWVVDAMTMRHVVDEREVTLYNVVDTNRRTGTVQH